MSERPRRAAASSRARRGKAVAPASPDVAHAPEADVASMTPSTEIDAKSSRKAARTSRRREVASTQTPASAATAKVGSRQTPASAATAEVEVAPEQDTDPRGADVEVTSTRTSASHGSGVAEDRKLDDDGPPPIKRPPPPEQQPHAEPSQATPQTVVPIVGATSEQELDLPSNLAILPSRDAVLYPGMLLAAAGDRAAVGAAAQRGGLGPPAGRAVLCASRPPRPAARTAPIGTAANIVRLLKLPDGSLQVLLQGAARIKLGAGHADRAILARGYRAAAPKSADRRRRRTRRA